MRLVVPRFPSWMETHHADSCFELMLVGPVGPSHKEGRQHSSTIPKSLISEFSTPTAVAVVATPILKLWPKYFPSSRPEGHNAALSLETSTSHDRGRPDDNMNISYLPLIAK